MTWAPKTLRMSIRKIEDSRIIWHYVFLASSNLTLAPRCVLGRCRALQEIGGLHTELTGKPIDHIDTGRVLASFERADVGPVDPGAMRELFLRQTSSAPASPQVGGQNLSYLHGHERRPLSSISPRSILDKRLRRATPMHQKERRPPLRFIRSGSYFSSWSTLSRRNLWSGAAGPNYNRRPDMERRLGPRSMFFSAMLMAQVCYRLSFHSRRWCALENRAMHSSHQENELGCDYPVASVHE